MVKQDTPTLLSKIGRFIKVAYETWKFFIQLVLFLFALGLTTGIWGLFIKSAPFITPGFGVAIFAGVIFIILSAYANGRPRFDVKVLKKYVTYRYYPDLKTMEHTKSYIIVSLVDNLVKFSDRYKWSCDKVGHCNVTLHTPHQRLEQIRVQEWNINEIIFDPPLHKAKEVEVALRWDLYCEGDAIPFLSQIVDHPTDYLELSVFVPYKPSDIKFIHFNSGEGVETDPNSIVEVKDGVFYLATGQMRYVVEKPKYGHKYMIHWTPPQPMSSRRNQAKVSRAPSIGQV